MDIITGNYLSRLRTVGNESIIDYLAGNESLKPEDLATSDNPGWYSPEDTYWKVNSDPSLLIGGLASLFLQTLHPRVMAGVADHSSYKDDPLGRFQRTGRFVAATTFGNKAMAEESVNIVNTIHERVVGSTPSGDAYKATDSELLGWVHVTEIYCFWKSFDQFGPDNHGLSADDYVSESKLVPAKLGYKTPPTTWTELESQLDSYSKDCKYGDQAATTVKFLLAPEVVPLAVKPAYLLVSAAALSLLPRWAREQLMIPIPPLVTPLGIRPAAKKLSELLRWFSSDPESASALAQAQLGN